MDLKGKAIEWKYSNEFNNALEDGVITREEFSALTPEEQAMLVEGLGGKLRFSTGDEIILRNKDTECSEIHSAYHYLSPAEIPSQGTEVKQGFFRKAWGKIKDFFINLFSSKHEKQVKKFEEDYVELSTSEYNKVAVEKTSGLPYDTARAEASTTSVKIEDVVSDLSEGAKEFVMTHVDIMEPLLNEIAALTDSISVKFVKVEYFDGHANPIGTQFNKVASKKAISLNSDVQDELKECARILYQDMKLSALDVEKVLSNCGVKNADVYTKGF